MCTTGELFQRIDEHKRCRAPASPGDEANEKACGEGDLYLATYIGPLYFTAKHKVLFVGLDHGMKTRNVDVDLRQRHKDMIEWPSDPGRDGKWNPHYQGCIKVAGYLLDSACLNDCTSRCALRAVPSSPSHASEANCVFLQFSQGNAVKCVPAGSQTMSFNANKRIPACLPLMFEELTVLRPDVIVLQGRRHLSKPLRKLVASKDGVEWKTTENGYVGIMVWQTWQSVVVALNHPARGWLARNWDGEIVPALDEARKHLRGSD
jgi:hypothetical protein